MVRINAYKCDHCGKVSANKGWLTAHENHCGFNPANRMCKGCNWWFKNRPEYGTKPPRDNIGGKFLPFCSNPDDDYSFNEYPGNYLEPPEEWNESQKNCEGWAPISPTLKEDRKALLRQEIAKGSWGQEAEEEQNHEAH